ncbi:ATP-binding cassette, subfamily B [Saccharicrinis carchari]|uniref:ATP-binding cassette, subfamily B n=1 Tax=Saccharicrinis carchari TaxID=1168039 RepID=A0A521DLZ2_SACCC|nr:ABC transporter ATP-binding protein [Saccharicrinis carchari]SMO72717.1 ATP-binding cassette, subfamily B [Saccharicrinis carchari]
MKKTSNNIFRSLKIVWQSSPTWSLVNAAVVLLKGVMPLLLIFIVQMLVDEVSRVLTGDHTVQGVESVYYILLFAGGVFVLNALLNSLSGIISEKHAYYIDDSVQDLIHKRTTKLDFANFDDYNFQNIYYRAINEATYRPKKIYYGFVGLIQNSITLALIAGLLAGLSWVLMIVLVLVSVPVVYIRLKYSRKIFVFNREHTEDERNVAYYNRLLTDKAFAKELRVFNLSGLFKKRFEEQKNNLRGKRYGMLKLKTAYELAVQLITAAALIVVFGFIASTAIQGNITQGQMVMYFLAMYRGYSFLQDLLSRISGLYEDGLFLKNLFEFIDFDVIRYEKKNATLFPGIMKEGVCIDNVSFKYPNSSRAALKNVSFNINPGETIALVGANGAGKSTLVKLLCGLYRPDQGSITFDGVDLSVINKDSLAENVSVVFQDFMLYNVTARENIWYGNVKRPQSDEEIVLSAQKSGIDKLITTLPNEYDTVLGTLFKDSEMLSVGEWQRIALSRSFFNNAQLVVLDEPTSSLDAFTESRLIENFKAITKDRTAIIVSHRLSTIHLADRIVVLNERGVAEVGTPSELLEKKAAFYDMVQSMRRNGLM